MKLKQSIFLLLLIFFSGSTILAQHLYTVQSDSSIIHINGTSSMHDWTIHLNTFHCSMKSLQNENSIEISNTKFHCNVEDLSSGNSIMDKKTYKALKYKLFPEIKFIQTNISHAKISPPGYSGTITGMLSIAGQTKPIQMSYQVQIYHLLHKVTSKLDVNMSDFGISPPTAMFGAITTGDKIEIIITQYFAK